MSRTKGAKNKVYKGTIKKIVCFKVTSEMLDWIKSQPNKWDYVRGLIERDMIEKGIPTKKEE